MLAARVRNYYPPHHNKFCTSDILCIIKTFVRKYDTFSSSWILMITSSDGMFPRPKPHNLQKCKRIHIHPRTSWQTSARHCVTILPEIMINYKEHILFDCSRRIKCRGQFSLGPCGKQHLRQFNKTKSIIRNKFHHRWTESCLFIYVFHYISEEIDSQRTNDAKDSQKEGFWYDSEIFFSCFSQHTVFF